MSPCLFPFFILISLNFLTYETKIITGSIKENNDWIYFTKFCFQNDRGEIRFELLFNISQCQPKQGKNNSHCLSLAFYHDATEVFRELYKGSERNVACASKIAPPYLDDETQLIYLDPSPLVSYQFATVEPQCELMADKETINCTNFRRITTVRPRWWFLALANCGNPDFEIEVFHYRLEMTNGNSYSRHFSYDEKIILETVGVTFGLSLLLLIVVIYSSIKLLHESMLHNTYIMYFIAVLMEIIGLFFIFISYLSYQSGTELLPLKNAGEFFSMLAHFIYLYLIMLLAKGYTVTRGSLRLLEYLTIAALFCFYLIIYCSTYGSYVYQQNNALVTHFYGSGLGIVAPVAKFIMLCFFCTACFTTLKKYPEKKRFYFPFITFHVVWFIAGIVVVFVAVYFLEDWFRAKVITLIKCAFNFITYAYFAYLVLPSKHNTNFPYHVKTNQIMSDEDGEKNYPHESEDTPTELKNGDTFSDIFNVGRNEMDPDVMQACRNNRRSAFPGITADNSFYPTPATN